VKLSEAMMLGSTTCKMVPGDWNTCALGAAANAVGIAKQMIIHRDLITGTVFLTNRASAIWARWPWLATHPSLRGNVGIGLIVASKFDNSVCRGLMTFEQLVDWIRSIEPDCGECNMYQCACQKTEVTESISSSESILA
jgi:hypothetical protein